MAIPLKLPEGAEPSQAELLACCAVTCVQTNLGLWAPDCPLTAVVRDCDFGADPCCNRITGAAHITPATGARAQSNIKTFDAKITIRVTRPQALCPDEKCGIGDECHTSTQDTFLMAEREQLTRHIEGWLAASDCADCCVCFDLTAVNKICGGECGGTKLELTARNFIYGSLTP